MENPLEGVILQVWKDIAGVADVSATDPFLGHGGNSLHFVRLASTLEKVLAVEVQPEEIFRSGDVRRLARHLDEKRGTAASATGGAADGRGTAGDAWLGSRVPASYGQSGIWFLDQFSAKPAAYNAPFVLKIRSPLDVEKLRLSLRAVVLHHESLRTTFVSEGGELVQKISDEAHFGFEVVPGSGEAALRRVVRDVVESELSLEHGPLVNVVCVLPEVDGDAAADGEDAAAHVVCNVHHIVFDASSAGIFLTDWFTAYEDLLAGREPALPQGRDQYRDFARGQRERLAPDVLERSLRYWEDKLAGPLPLLDLPLDRPRPAAQSHDGDIVRFGIGAELTGRLRRCAADEGVTPFMLLLSAYAVFLHKHARQDELLVGTPASLRDAPGARGAVGYFVNMITLRHRLDGEMTGRDLLRQVREEVTSALTHKEAPFEKVVERVQPPRSRSRPPLFQTTFVMPHSGTGALNRLATDLEVDLYPSQSAKYDLSLVIEQEDPEPGSDGAAAAQEAALRGIFEFDTALFDTETVEAFGRRFLHVLRALVEDPGRTVGSVPLLDGAERREILAVCDRTAEGTRDGRVTAMFERQAARTPGAVALEFEGRELTYRELDALSNQLAHTLRGHGVGPGRRVGIFMDRSVEMVTALLGVLKAGASYVPVDPGYPADRIAYMLADSRVSLVVSSGSLAGRLPQGTEVFDVDRAGETAGAPRHSLRLGGAAGEMYVIYTSGSTGLPKGVVIEHATIANLVECQKRISPCGARVRTLQYMTLSFDVSLMEIFGTLCAGGTLVLMRDELRQDLHRLAEFVAGHHIGRVYLPYVAVHQLAAVAAASGLRLDSLEEVASVGEQLVITPQIREFFTDHTGARLLNMYGPSETHLATWHEVRGEPRDWPEAPPIGEAIPGLRLLALDGDSNLVPPGVPGELYIGGEVISPGYNGLPEETARRFTADPFAPAGDGAGTRLYRTGDLVRLVGGREFEYLGRADDQLKIRGYRIEPAEVEAALNDLPSVRAAAVAAVSFGPGDKRLVGFVVTDGPVDGTRLRRTLAGSLPGHLVPSHFVRIAHLPTTPSGKIDRKALPELYDAGGETVGEAADFADADAAGADAAGAGAGARAGATPGGRRPATPTEQLIAREWAGVLKTGEAQVAADDDFFEAGGHSLLATELMYRVRKRFGIGIAMRRLFEAPTVAGMAATVEESLSGGDGQESTARPATGGLREDVSLPAHIALPQSGGAPAAVRRNGDAASGVLLTGATGFLGGYLLRELLAETGSRVHCLVRAADVAEAWAKLRANAERYGFAGTLDREHDGGRVVPVPGDLARERFGLTEDEYGRLADSVDAVYHAAASINFVAPYASVKSANVDGLTRVLELSVHSGRVRPVHHMSTLAVFSPKEREGVITEDSVPDDEEHLGIGYTQSKWVAEHIALLAGDRGLPVTVYRIGRISGDSETGACQRDDFLWRQIESFIQTGSAPHPAGTKTDLLPVDFVARAVVRLSGMPEAENRVLHLFHPEGAGFEVVHQAIRESGFPLETVHPDEWFAALARSAASQEPPGPAGSPGANALAAAVPLFQEGALELGRNTYDNAMTSKLLAGAGMEYPDITPDFFTAMIAYFRRAGELPGGHRR